MYVAPDAPIQPDWPKVEREIKAYIESVNYTNKTNKRAKRSVNAMDVTLYPEQQEDVHGIANLKRKLIERNYKISHSTSKGFRISWDHHGHAVKEMTSVVAG
jgi:hypothetical protein